MCHFTRVCYGCHKCFIVYIPNVHSLPNRCTDVCSFPATFPGGHFVDRIRCRFANRISIKFITIIVNRNAERFTAIDNDNSNGEYPSATIWDLTERKILKKIHLLYFCVANSSCTMILDSNQYIYFLDGDYFGPNSNLADEDSYIDTDEYCGGNGCFSADDSKVISSCCDEGKIWVRDTHDREIPNFMFTAHTGCNPHILSVDKYCISIDENDIFKWEYATGNIVGNVKLNGTVKFEYVTFGSSCNLLIGCCRDGIKMWNLVDGTELVRMHCLCFAFFSFQKFAYNAYTNSLWLYGPPWLGELMSLNMTTLAVDLESSLELEEADNEEDNGISDLCCSQPLNILL